MGRCLVADAFTDGLAVLLHLVKLDLQSTVTHTATDKMQLDIKAITNIANLAVSRCTLAIAPVADSGFFTQCNSAVVLWKRLTS